MQVEFLRQQDDPVESSILVDAARHLSAERADDALVVRADRDREIPPTKSNKDAYSELNSHHLGPTNVSAIHLPID